MIALFPAILYLVGALLCIRQLFIGIAAASAAVVAVTFVCRRVFWKRCLRVLDDRMEVPSGLLRLRLRPVRFDDVQAVWVARIFITDILCIRTSSGTVEIQDIYLPDGVTLRQLRDHIVTNVERTHHL